MTHLSKRLDRIDDYLPDVPDAHGYMPRPPRDLGEFAAWVEAGYGFRCPPHSIWYELAREAAHHDGESTNGTIH
jgi:hypothetical protein